MKLITNNKEIKTIKANQAISAGHKTTAEAAKTILEAGGNAFDAAIAAALTMLISEPCMCSAGAGGFAMCLKAGEEIKLLDFFSQTPEHKVMHEDLDFYPIKVDFGNEIETFHIGLASVATPGLLKGLQELHNRYGTMPLSRIIEVPIQYAKDGVRIDRFQSHDLSLLQVIIKEDPTVRDSFFVDDKVLSEGNLFHLPHLEGFLDMLRHEGMDEFYKGEPSRIIDAVSKERGGFIRRSDLEDYKAIWRKPLLYNYGSGVICTPPPPSLGGMIVNLFLKLQEEHGNNWVKTIQDIKSHGKSAESIARLFNEHFPDQYQHDVLGAVSTRGTSHFNILDAEGNAISFTVSIGEGCGYFIEGTDMQLNNMLGEDFLLPGGFHSWTENNRLNSKMTPTMVCDKELQLLYAGGSGGASRIPYVIAEVLQRYMEHPHELEKAVDAARAVTHHHMVHVEKDLEEELYSNNGETKIWNESSLFFGGVHSIAQYKGHIQAAPDHRRHGHGIVF